MKKYLLLLAIIVILSASCKKDTECYTCHDRQGNDLGRVCGKSEDDAFKQVKGNVVNGMVIQTKEQFLANYTHD